MDDSGRYRPIREIARGGMGRVIEAHDTELNRTVAVKVSLAEHHDARARFEREVEITARLEHPSIVPLYDAGRTAASVPFYVMRKVAGDPLDALIRNATSLDQRLRLLTNVLALADAVAHAHARGVIHRDLKPSNVLVGELGETVVIDWGLAKLIGERDDDAPPEQPSGGSLHTRVGTVFGTPGFMPPEQLAGDLVDERADVYALGGCLYHVLAGARPPEEGAPDFKLAGVPIELITIVKKAMDPRRERRYLDAGGFGEDLRRFLDGQLVAAHTYPVRARIARWLRRHRGIVAVAALALALAIAGGLWSLQRTFAERMRVEDALVREQLRADELLLFKASSYLEHDATLAAATLQQLRESSPRWSTLGVAMAGMRARGIAYGYPGLGAHTQLVASPTDDRFLVVTLGRIALLDPGARTLRTLADGPDVIHARWWRDKVVLVHRETPDVVLDLETNTTGTAPWPADRRDLRFTDDGAAFFRTSDGVSLIAAEGTRTAIPVGVTPTGLDVDPTGRWLVVTSRDQLIVLHAVAPDRFTPVIHLEARGAVTTFDHDRRLAVSYDPKFVEYDLTASPPVVLRRGAIDVHGLPRYVGGHLHWWTAGKVLRFDGDRPLEFSSAFGSYPEVALDVGHAVLVTPRRIDLLGSVNQTLAAPEDVEVIAGRRGGRFLVAAGPSRLLTWRLDELGARATTVPIVDELVFTGRDTLIGVHRFPGAPTTIYPLQIGRSQEITAGKPTSLSDRAVISAHPGGTVVVIEGRRVRLLSPTQADVTGLDEISAIDADGDTVIAGTSTGAIHRVDGRTGRVRDRLAEIGFPIVGLSARAGWICASSVDGRMWRRDPRGHVTTTIVPRWVSFSLAPDGTQFVARGSEVVMWEPDRAPATIVTFSSSTAIAVPYAGARHVVISTADRVVHRYDRQTRAITPLLSNALAVTGSQAGVVAATVQGNLVVADVDAGFSWRLAEQINPVPGGIAISLDGRRLVAATPSPNEQAILQVWTLEPGTRDWLMSSTNAIAPELASSPPAWRP